MTRRLYVYYRVSVADLGATVAAVRTMQIALTAKLPGLRAELLRRPEQQDGTVTLMETYAGDATGVATELVLAAQALPQPRHLEWFEEMA